MQISVYTGLKKIVDNRDLATAIKVAIFLFTAVFTWLHISNGHEVDTTAFATIVNRTNLPWLILVVALLPLNWALEARKWQLLTGHIERQSFANAFAGVLTGLSFSMFAPQLAADYAGRVLQLESRQRFAAAGALLAGNMAQLMATLLFGWLGGLYFLQYTGQSLLLLLAAAVLPAIVLAALAAIYLRSSRLLYFLSRKISNKAIGKFINTAFHFSRQKLVTVQMLSLLRYAVFTAQFVIMCRLAGVTLAMPAVLCGISLIFLAKTIMPTLNMFGDLGVREFTAIMIFGHLGQHGLASKAIVSASLMVWLVNILLPTVLGLFFILRIKLFPGK